MADSDSQTTQQRLLMALIGACGGFSFYLLIEWLGRGTANPDLFLFLCVLAGVFFGGVLAMIGPLSTPRATVSALVVALPTAGLMLWAGTRDVIATDILSDPQSMLAALVLASVPLPFLISAGQPGGRWTSYPVLFTQSWNIVVRYAAAWLFVGMAWIVLFLTDSLFSLIGLTVIRDYLMLGAGPYLITGLGLGLALAVANEMSEYIAPFFVLRLLRLFLPVLPVIIAIFLLGLLLHGLSNFLHQLSLAETLLGMALLAATLISTAVDQSDAEAVQSPLMQRSVEALALMLPLLAALCLWADGLRVAQYGWTPPRIAALEVALIVLAYGLLYAGAVIARRNWRARIRGANTVMALICVAAAALWLSPLIDVNGISARDQLARYLSEKTSQDQRDLASLHYRMGRTGAALYDELKARAAQPGQDALRAHIAADEGWASATVTDTEATANRAKLRKLLPVQPTTTGELLDRILLGAPAPRIKDWLDACARTLPDGKPGCALVHGTFLPDLAGEQAVLATMNADGYLDFDGFAIPDTGAVRVLSVSTLRLSDQAAQPAGEVLAAMQSGALTPTPPRLKALDLRDRELLLLP
ncbi:MAG: DUF4153 domain-containing protein [Paracoccaceae bacterium]|nr:DUF4153 domain-containing protein [Paracoccaceae bacterium]